MAMDSQITVGELVVRHPGAAKVLSRHRIDFCCGGDRSLRAACAERGLRTATVLAEIRKAKAPADAPDWTALSTAEICDTIEHRFHRPLDSELPRLDRLAQKVSRVHGERHPEIVDLARAVTALRGELSRHMAKEERILFPMIRAEGAAPPPPIGAMRHDHDATGATLRRFRELTADYRLPSDACGSYRALFEGLEALEHALHVHIHVENEILFPRALAGDGRTRPAASDE